MTKKGWNSKMDLGYPLPENHLPVGRVCVQFEIPDDQTYAADVVGHIMELGKWWNWEKAGGLDRRATETAQLFRTAIHETLCVEKYRTMGCNCPDPTTYIYTYDADGNLQVSTDGGATSAPAPQDDIRVNPKVQYPPIPASESDDTAKCIAADGMAKLLKEQVGSQLTDDMSRYTLTQLIDDWTKTVIGTSNPFEALAKIVSNQIFALTIATIRAAITDDTYDKLKCIFLCRMDESGFFTGGAWSETRSQILSDISGIAGVFFEHLVYLIGNGGLSNLARSGAGSPAADCSDCEDCNCPNKCDTVWTFYGVHDVVFDGCNTYTMKADGGGAHVAFSSGNPAEGCYCDPHALEVTWNWWSVTRGGPRTDVNPKSEQVWNLDLGGPPAETVYTFTFSSAVIT